MRLDASGGPARAICGVDFTPGGGTWNRDGVIVFSDVSGFRIFRVSAAGGEAKPIIQLDKSQQTAQLILPEFLPDGRHFLYLSHGSARDELYAGSLNAADAPVLVPEGSSTLYTPPGFLIYGNRETLLARRFDPVKLRLTGNAIPIAEHVGRMTMEPASLVSVSENGVLVYRGGGFGPVQLAWHNREGVRQGSIGPPAIYQEVDLSPNERRVAVKRYDSGKEKNEIWVLEISTGIPSEKRWL
jgi:hypothetical protein